MPQKTIYINQTPFWVPPHTKGDREFKGHGPDIWLSTRLSIVNSQKIRARVYMKAQEDRADWTTSEGYAEYDVWNSSIDIDVGRITGIQSSTYCSAHRKQDGGHHDFSIPGYGPVQEFRVVGDTRGSEAGTKTGCSVKFNPCVINYIERPLAQGIKTIDHEIPVLSYIPPCTRGDNEFDGHGPRVWCTVYIEVKNGRELWATVWMKAQEDRSDWTTAEGTKSFLLYTNDKKIVEIVTDQSSSHYYKDSNHAEDEYTLSEGELVNRFIFVGDTRGKEAGTRTGVTVHFHPISFREG